MIHQRFRQDYAGEFVVLHTTFRGGIKIQQREWIENPIQNQHISGRAAIILSERFRDRFDHRKLEHHRGGLLGSNRLQTYSTGDIWKSMRLDFYVTTDQQQLSDIAGTSYGDDTVVYSDRRGVLAHPGTFFLTPYSVRLSDPAAAMYLACFDQHRELYVLGADRDLQCNQRSWIDDINSVMRCYYDCQFYFVGTESMMPDAWRQQTNFRVLDYRRFVTHCDI